MRFVFLAGAASLLVMAATFACSSSTPPAATEEDSGTSLPKTEDPPEEDSDPDPGSSSGNPPPTDAGADDADTPDDGGGGSTAGDAGVQCEPTSIRESEKNDTEQTADSIAWKTGSYCGRLTAGDVDVLTFTIPNSQNGFSFTMNRTQSGNYKVECSVDGQSFAFNGNYPYVIEKPYFCKISLNGNTPADYRINLNVTPN